MKHILAVATVAFALGTPAFANELDSFARLSWSDKVKLVVAAGGQYHRDCAAVLSGQRGIKTCMHVTEAVSAQGDLLTVRAGMDNSFHQWCVGSYSSGRMTCYSQEYGSATTFILLDNVWHSVN
jgi:hypothetical protein